MNPNLNLLSPCEANDEEAAAVTGGVIAAAHWVENVSQGS